MSVSSIGEATAPSEVRPAFSSRFGPLPAAFEAAYPEQIALARKLPGLTRLQTSKVWPKEDGSPTPAYRLLDLYFADYGTASAAAAEAGALVGATLEHATGGVVIAFAHHHAGRHGGGHAGYYISPVHDYHNVSDCGLDTWRESNALARELPAHEIGHSVESASNGAHGSPAYEIWGDSKWAEFYIYDLYTALGMDREAKGVYRRFSGNTDDFPRRGTRWFRDWFYPLWRDCGQAQVMNRFFRDLAGHFPRDSGGTYTRRMNWGEYVHFTSGAAAADMSGQAARAFGWPGEWADQLEHARAQFPAITY